MKFVPEWTGKEGQVKEAFAYYDKLIYPGQKVLGAVDPERMAKLQDFYLAKRHHREEVAGGRSVHQSVRHVERIL